jgi:crotonobetainyl-CoA:carnitine CoA-transferase CaiB-like acyl-CoA transferase
MFMLSSFFQDLRVVELSSVLAGPAVGMFFAELGAQVIKIENKTTGGDVTRSWKLPQEPPEAAYSAYYHSANWGKQSHLLDLQEQVDRQQVMTWISQADVLISNFRAGSAAKLGLAYEQLKAAHPRLIYACVSAYGEEDPRPGFDAMIQAETGWMSMNGEAGGKPVKMPVALMDLLAAHQLKEGILLALMQRQQSGQGCKVSVSLYEAAVASLANQASNWLNLGVLPQRMGSRHPNISPYGDIFYTQDGQDLLLGTGTQAQFEGLCEVLACPQLATDPRFLTNALRLENRDILAALLQEAFGKFSASALLEQAREKRLTLSPINNLQQVFEQAMAQDLVLEEKQAGGEASKRVKTAVFRLES